MVQRIAVALPALKVRAISNAVSMHLGIRRDDRDQPDALRFSARQGFVGQQVVARLGQSAQQRPDDDGVIARRHAELGVPIENPRIIRGHRHVREQGDGQSRAHRAAADRRHHRLGAIDEVVDQVAGFLPNPDQRGFIVDHAIDHVEIAAGGKIRAFAADQHHAHRLIDVDAAPNLRQIPMHILGGGIQAALIRHHELENARLLAREAQAREIPSHSA